MNVQVLLLCAGKSRRLGGHTSKPWLMLHQKPVMQHALDAFSSHPEICGGVIVIAEGDQHHLNLDDKNWKTTTGGEERHQSVRNGLEALVPQKPDYVLIHDAARPFVSKAVIDRVINALAGDEAEAVIPVVPCADSLKRITSNTVSARLNRDAINHAQTPQGFKFATILDLHRNHAHPPPDSAITDAQITDDSSLAEDAGICVKTVAGDPMLGKITTPADFTLATIIAQGLETQGLANQGLNNAGVALETRTATGFDIHRFDTASNAAILTLGGVKIEHEHPLAAHSDGDVVLHALTDAVFGLLADGDIGEHFPPSDKRWKDHNSGFFLAQSVSKLEKLGGVITLADVTIIAETPHIAPHRNAMKTAIAAIMGIAETRVSVKATTAEKLGDIGAKKGIATQAAVTAIFPLMPDLQPITPTKRGK